MDGVLENINRNLENINENLKNRIISVENELKENILDVRYFHNKNQELDKYINEIFETRVKNNSLVLEEHVFDIRDLYGKNRELTEEVKKIKKYVEIMDQTCSLKNEIAFGINVKISCLEEELVNQQKINQYLLTRIYVIFSIFVIFYSFGLFIISLKRA